jgi:hypothetical protein
VLTAAFLLLLIQEATPLDPELASAAASRLGVPEATLLAAARSAPHWRGGAARLQRRLTGNGFHRTLHLDLQLDGLPSGVSGACRPALLQPLPSGLFADPYQLDDLQRAAAGAAFGVVGPLDLEL